MGRPPIGLKAMTSTKRYRRWRERHAQQTETNTSFVVCILFEWDGTPHGVTPLYVAMGY
jgi:hypothetical protein